jgi:DNA polymerase-1
MVIFSDEDCELCGAHSQRPFSVGPRDAKVVVVTNRKSSGTFQKNLEQQLTEVGLDTGEIYFTPVIKCAEFDVHLSNKQLKEHAAQYIIPELLEMDPDFILLLGNEALVTIAGKSGITNYKGKELEPKNGLKAMLMGTVSPSSVNRNPSQKPSYMADLRLFANKVKGLSSGIDDPKYIVGDTNEKLKKIYGILDNTDEIYVDIETYAPGGEYYEPTARMVSIAATCISRPDSFGHRTRAVFAIPLWHPQSPWRNNWQRLLRVIAKHCVSIRKVVAHNASFDCKWLIWNGVILYPTFDTMLAVHLLNENVLKGLKPQAVTRLGVAPWGIDTGDLTKYPIKEVLHYNVLDTWYMYWIKQQLIAELKEQPRLARIFKFITMPAQRDLIDSEIRGAWIDVKRLNERKPIAERNLLEVEERIRTAAQLPSRDSDEWPHTIKHMKTMDKRIPWEENYNASNFARWMLFEWCGLPVLERGKDKDDGSPGDPSMAEDVLKHLEKKHPVIPAMLDRVTKQKHLSSFFNPYAELYDDDHRIHTTFKLAGTVTGRLSSGKPDADKISGSRGKMRGVNLQQVPRDPFIRGLFGAPPGWTFVEADYSQIELRIAAFMADETTMKHIYAIGGDIHLSTAARVTGLPESEVTKEIRKVVGKPVNFGFLYGMQWLKFIDTAFNNYGSVFTEYEAKAARRAYFELYPKLLPWHAKMRRLANEYGRIVSPIGRIRHLPDIYSPDRSVRAEAERQAINSPVQGFGSDLAVIAMIEINRRLRELGWDQYAHCLGLVHDAINFEIRDDYVARVIPLIKDCMEDMDHVYRLFGTVVDIPIVADVSVGQHWGDKLELLPEQVYDFDLKYKYEKLGKAA